MANYEDEAEGEQTGSVTRATTGDDVVATGPIWLANTLPTRNRARLVTTTQKVCSDVYVRYCLGPARVLGVETPLRLFPIPSVLIVASPT